MAKTAYSSKAELYHKYRWDYPAAAAEHIVSESSINKRSVLLDVGAGTGKLTKHFTGFAATVYAVEPDASMSGILADNVDGVTVLHRFADHMPEIPDGSVDVIVAAHALHWCDVTKTLPEFNRVAKDGCMLHSVENNNVSDHPLFKETGALIRRYTVESVRAKHDFNGIGKYFSDERVCERSFGHMAEINFETYLGSLASMSYIPSPADTEYAALEKDARELFNAYVEQTTVNVEILTTVKSGLLAPVRQMKAFTSDSPF